MLLKANLRISQMVALLGVAGLFLCCVEMTRAQSTDDDSRNVVEIPAHELSQIKEELKFLRARDAERQAWQDSVMKRLPEPPFDLVGHRRTATGTLAPEFPACDVCDTPSCECPTSGCPSSGCASRSRSCNCCCGCYPCLCPLPPAPCIECPHVSTLNPYFNVNIFGALKLDMIFNTARPLAAGTPFFLLPDSIAGLDQTTVDIHARQSMLGAAFTGPQIGSFQSGGLLTALFYNDAVIVDRYGLLPLQAYGELRNQDWRFAAGLQFDIFAPGLPTVLPFSALAASGNPGNSFRGQIRLERFLNPANDVQWTIQLGISEPITSTIDPAFGLLEDNGWPNVEGRLALGLGPVQGAGLAARRPFEVGVSGIVGQIRNTGPIPIGRVVADVWGLSGDFRWRVNDVFGVSGEFYTGQALGTYNAGILQNINFDTLSAIRSSGGWLEFFVYLTPCLHNHLGYAIDDPIDRDVVAATNGLERTLNTTLYNTLLWDLNQTFRVGFEFTWRETNYADVGVPDNEGAGFHTQFQWAF